MNAIRFAGAMTLLASASVVACADTPAAAPLAPTAVTLVPYTVPEILKRVPPLAHDNSGRFPMISIAAFRMAADDNSWEGGKPLPPEAIRELVKRGFTQWIPPRESYIPYALALQAEGAAVIMMEGQAFNGPAGDIPDGLHQLPPDFKRDPDQPAQQPHYPCPLLLEGWRRKAEELRATFRKYKEAGVNVRAVWFDWEVEPFGGESEWKEARACTRCRAMFPPGILDDHDKYRAFIARWRNQLFSTYFVAPILEQYPQCSVTNWEEVISTAEHRTPNWTDSRLLPPTGIGMYTAANPVVYGDTNAYDLHWKEHPGWPLDEAHMDRVYTEVMFAQISGYEANALREAPEKQSVPWVDRYCADNPDPKIPILSRPRYREILRHAWLRGADAMQVFNPDWFKDARHNIELEELEDAQAIYDEMLGYRKFLDGGTPINLDAPSATYDGPIWSGRRLGDEALVRGFTQGTHAVTATITPFEGGPAVEIACPPEGATYLIRRDGGKVAVVKQ